MWLMLFMALLPHVRVFQGFNTAEAVNFATPDWVSNLRMQLIHVLYGSIAKQSTHHNFRHFLCSSVWP